MNLPPFDESLYNRSGKVHITILNTVFDVTEYQSKHPGGRMALTRAVSENGIECLITRHRRNIAVLEKRLRQMVVGRVVRFSRADIDELKRQNGESPVLQMFLRVFEAG